METNALDSSPLRRKALRARDLRIPVGLAKWPFVALAPGKTELSFQPSLKENRRFVNCDLVDGGMTIATLNDLEVIVFLTSLLVRRSNEGRPLTASITFRTADFLRVRGAAGSGRQHQLVAAAIERLAKTHVATCLDAMGLLYQFRLIESYQPPDGRRGVWCVVVPQWLIDQVEKRQVIQIDPIFFKLRGLQRRLYLWAEAHASGKQGYERLELSFAHAHAKAGSADSLTKYAFQLKRQVAAVALPSHRLSVRRDGKTDYLIIEHMPGDRVFNGAASQTINGFNDAELVANGTDEVATDDDTTALYVVDDAEDVALLPRPREHPVAELDYHQGRVGENSIVPKRVTKQLNLALSPDWVWFRDLEGSLQLYLMLHVFKHRNDGTMVIGDELFVKASLVSEHLTYEVSFDYDPFYQDDLAEPARWYPFGKLGGALRRLLGVLDEHDLTVAKGELYVAKDALLKYVFGNADWLLHYVQPTTVRVPPWAPGNTDPSS